MLDTRLESGASRSHCLLDLASPLLCFLPETEEEHQDTLSLMQAVGHDTAYVF